MASSAREESALTHSVLDLCIVGKNETARDGPKILLEDNSTPQSHLTMVMTLWGLQYFGTAAPLLMNAFPLRLLYSLTTTTRTVERSSDQHNLNHFPIQTNIPNHRERYTAKQHVRITQDDQSAEDHGQDGLSKRPGSW
jgi:hypothetical protein